MIRRSLLISSVLIGIQGYIGWYMVQSGLTQRVDVSQYRLSVHLCMAFIIIYNTLMLCYLKYPRVGFSEQRRPVMPIVVKVSF